MPALQPLPADQAPEAVQQTYGRIQDMFDGGDIPAPFLLYGHVEPFLKDFYMNFKKFVYTDGKLDAKTKAVIAYATSCHAKSKPWMDYFEARCTSLGVTEEQLAEIVAVASTNYMYNTFFKFRKLSGSDRFEGLPVGLRAHTFTNTSLDDQTVELVNLAISDLNACEPCVTGHIAKAQKLDLKDAQILEAIQCAATIYAGAMFLNSVG